MRQHRESRYEATRASYNVSCAEQMSQFRVSRDKATRASEN